MYSVWLAPDHSQSRRNYSTQLPSVLTLNENEVYSKENGETKNSMFLLVVLRNYKQLVGNFIIEANKRATVRVGASLAFLSTMICPVVKPD